MPIMAATAKRELSRLFSGSLAEDMARHSNKSMLMVYKPSENIDEV